MTLTINFDKVKMIDPLRMLASLRTVSPVPKNKNKGEKYLSLPLSNSFTVFKVYTHTSLEAEPTEKSFHRLTQKLNK